MKIGCEGHPFHRSLRARAEGVKASLLLFLVEYLKYLATLARALQAGVICYLTKPFSEDDLLACIRSTLGRRKARGKGS